MSPGLLDFPGYREDLLIVDIHFGPEKVQEHEPGTKESVLINTGEEACQVLIDQNQIGVDRRRSQYREQGVHISGSEMIWTCRGNKLENESGENVEHWSEWGIDKGNNRYPDGSWRPDPTAHGYDRPCWR